MEIHSMRIDHGPVQTNTMSYPQRQTQNHRPSHNQTVHSSEIYKPSRSPLSTTRYPYPPSPQLQSSPSSGISQVSQRYPHQLTPPMATVATVSSSQSQQQSSPLGVFRDYRHTNRISLLHPEYSGNRSQGQQSLSQPQREASTLPTALQQSQQSAASSVLCIDGLQGSGQPLKKIRLQDKEGIQPLRIDTKPGTYHPQVEAISPTFPDQLTLDDQAFRTTKDELIQQIGKVDREIAKAESQIAILKKKQSELEEIANKPMVKLEVEEDTTPKHQSLPQKIYAENRKKAQNAHAQLDSLGSKVEWPIYNQPSDVPIYHENKRRHLAFKQRLLDYFKKKHTEQEERNSYLSNTYSKMMQEWLRKVERIESSTKRKVKEAKNREFFEKVFPELRKQREDKERFNRVGARVKSEADMEEIMDNLQEQALEDKKMRSYAVIPPILLDEVERKIRYANNNGYIEDMETVYKSRQFINIWTPSEKETFKEKYLQHPKNFGVIASYLDRKSVSDCVQYYYLSKKTENYKQLFRKARQRTRSSRNNTQKVNTSANTSVVDILTTGVTTRLQREQQARTVVQQSREHLQSTEPITSSTPPAMPTATALSPTPSITNADVMVMAVSTVSNITSVIAPSPSSGISSNISTNTVISTISTSSSDTISVPVSTDIGDKDVGLTLAVESNGNTDEGMGSTPPPTTLKTFLGFRNESGSDDVPKKLDKFFRGETDGKRSDSGDTTTNDLTRASTEVTTGIKKEIESPPEKISDQTTTLTENKKKKERRKEKETAIESSDEDASSTVTDKSIQGRCAVCQSQLGSQLHSRPLMPNQASQYGLQEDQVLPNSRVCNTCRCKCVRSRYTHCPLLTCSNSRGRVKRLRSFPYKLQDLPSDIMQSLLAEFRIPSGVTKCCSACFNRIQRELGPTEDWPEEDINKLQVLLKELGTNWQLIGERLNKSPQKVKLFCATNRKKLKDCFGENRKPTLSTDEESGSSTSSCEESLIDGDHHSSDTASAAESPPIQGSNDNPIKKVDYDSSATETADEAQTPDNYQGSATIMPVTNDGQPRPNTSPLSVKDIVLNVIEYSLKKIPGSQQHTQTPPTSGTTPTISSILNNDSNEVTIVGEYNLNNMNNQQRQVNQHRTELNLAKLVNPLIPATITPVSGPIQPPTQPETIQSPRNDLIICQIQDGRESETLDLSIKKSRELSTPIHGKIQTQQGQQIQLHRSESYMYHQERKSPAFSVRSQTKLPSPKPANPKSGSITLGTPIISQTRQYEGLLRQIPEAKMGSITQGTPIQIPQSMQDKRPYEYFNKRGSIPSQQSQNQQPQYPGQYRQPSYTVEQQLSSRQIIMNDYITSQQMLGRRNEKSPYYPSGALHRTPPPSQQIQQRQGVIQRHTRPQYLQPGHEAMSTLVDVAIQQPSLPVPSGPHEGLGKTMADNILEQPHRYQIIQHQQMRQQQQHNEEQRRFNQQAQQQQQHPQQKQQQQQVQQQQQSQTQQSQQLQQQQQKLQHQSQIQQVRQQVHTDSSTLTAASLIDAIITHQINQTTEGGREVVTNTREQRAGDLLFQNFHRGDPPSQQNQDNGEMPSSVISVDLDSDSVNLTVKELTDSVISHDFSTRQANYYHLKENTSEQWKKRIQAQQNNTKEDKHLQPSQDERQIIRVAQSQQKYHTEPVSPPENNHWSDQNFRRYQQSQSHMSPLDYVKNKIVEVMRTEDDKKESREVLQPQEKDQSSSPGDMVIDEEKNENDFNQQQPSQQQGFFPYVHNDNTANENSRSNEPKPLLSAQYEPLSDED